MPQKLTGLLLSVFLIGCFCHPAKYELVRRWHDGTNDVYDIEVEVRHWFDGVGHQIFIPDVRFVQKNERFISGRAFWRYPDRTYGGTDGKPDTNEFWFVLDKCKKSPKCYVFLSTNYNSWVAFCATNKVPTNLLDVNQYREANPLWSGAGPAL